MLAACLTACSSAGPSLSGSFSLSPKPLLGKFVWHDLITDDPATASRFYGQLFGWTFEEAVRPGGGSYLLIRSGSRYVAGMVQLDDPPDGAEYSRWLGYLSVANVDAAVKQTLAAGGAALREPRQIGQVGRAAVIRDPQGAVLGLLRSQHGDPDDSMPASPGVIAWNELLAGDDAAAAGFYRALGNYDTRRVERRGGDYFLLSDGQRERAGILQNPFDEAPPAWLTHFFVADVAAASRRTEALGGTVLLAPSPDFRDGSVALIADPTGAILVLSEI